MLKKKVCVSLKHLRFCTCPVKTHTSLNWSIANIGATPLPR